jgi:hypothetical protein
VIAVRASGGADRPLAAEADREGENKAHSEQNLVGRHGSFQF